jgi:hypothetical protein
MMPSNLIPAEVSSHIVVNMLGLFSADRNMGSNAPICEKISTLPAIINVEATAAPVECIFQ